MPAIFAHEHLAIEQLHNAVSEARIVFRVGDHHYGAAFIVELAQDQPVLFLLEEILTTTNSHDRRIGARAVIGSLLASGAIGLVTTHDLAISEIVEELPGARNVHFVDHLEEGQIRFDYHLREGVVSKSNALDLMRSIGLDV